MVSVGVRTQAKHVAGLTMTRPPPRRLVGAYRIGAGIMLLAEVSQHLGRGGVAFGVGLRLVWWMRSSRAVWRAYSRICTALRDLSRGVALAIVLCRRGVRVELNGNLAWCVLVVGSLGCECRPLQAHALGTWRRSADVRNRVWNCQRSCICFCR